MKQPPALLAEFLGRRSAGLAGIKIAMDEATTPEEKLKILEFAIKVYGKHSGLAGLDPVELRK